MQYTLTMNNGALQLPKKLLEELGLGGNATVNVLPAGAGMLLQPVGAQDVSRETIYMQQFSPHVQERFGELMARNNEGLLSERERDELTGLVSDYERLLLENSEMLLRTAGQN